MKVTAFIGSSGTGKSYRAMTVARDCGIRYVIDDGLLIRENKVIAGKSVKKEPTKLASVRRALFSSKSHADGVKAVLAMEKPDSILILGTSEKMVNYIVSALDLGSIDEIIRIEDVATPEEIRTALRIRTEQGKHVIPVPTVEIKKYFSGYFMDALNIFKNGNKGEFYDQKTVIRPTYSYFGNYTIQPSALEQLCAIEMGNFPEVTRLLRMHAEQTPDGAAVELDLEVKYPCVLTEIALRVKQRVAWSLEEYMAITAHSININIKKIVV